MTYAGFLLVFLLPPLGCTCWAAHRSLQRQGTRAELRRTGTRLLLVLMLAAWLWTTPWDSWIIRRGVWGYHEGTVLAALFHVPLEEFLFMAGQTAAVGALTLCVIARIPERPAASVPRPVPSLRRTCAAWWAALAAVGLALALAGPHGTYLGSTLVWFGPLLAVQALAGADVLKERRTERLRILVPALLYLWSVDCIAITLGVWHISDHHTYGWAVFGLPLEEGVFFTVTSLLVVNGLVLGTDAKVQARVMRRTLARR
jgi:lycopene cyclase domain-containing protein